MLDAAVATFVAGSFNSRVRELLGMAIFFYFRVMSDCMPGTCICCSQYHLYRIILAVKMMSQAVPHVMSVQYFITVF